MRFSLKYRIALIIFVLEAIMMTAVLWATLDHSETSTREQFESSERAILSVMGGISHIALQTGQYDQLQPYFNDLLEDSRIAQVMLVDARGIIVAGTRPGSIGKFPTAFSATETIDTETSARRVWRTQEIRNQRQRLGVLAIEISNAALVESTTDARNLGSAIAVTGMALIALVGLAAGFLLTRRLAGVTDAAQRFAQGETDARARVGGRDEIGDLGHTFDRMADNLQARSREARELIEQLSEKNAELERFSYTVSHDLKAPLVTIKGYLGMVRKDLDEGMHERIERDFEFIASATDTMAQLLEDLLELSRVGRVISDMEPVALNELFEQARRLLAKQIQDSGVTLTLQPDMPWVWGDRQRLGEVAQNLLDNAIKFSREAGRPEVSVSASEAAGQVTCDITDNGIGIAPEFQEQVFGLFNRLDTAYDGTGIGLALVKRIIEVHEGRVWVESDGEGQGARFRFRLPAAEKLRQAS